MAFSFSCLLPSNQGPEGLLLLFCPQGLISCLQIYLALVLCVLTWKLGHSLWEKHLRQTPSSSSPPVHLLCDQHMADSHVCCCCHQRSCRIHGFLRGELSLKKSLVYSVSGFIFHQSYDVLGTSPSLRPLRALASNFPFQETSAGEARLGPGLLQDIGQARHPDPVT